MNRLLALSFILAAPYGLIARSGAAPAFEVVSIRPPAPDGRHGVWTNGSVSRIQTLGLNLKSLIGFSYDVESYQILSEAGIDKEQYDVIAKVPPETEKLSDADWWKQVHAMSQTMLADRFGLVIHRETRELPVYRLIPGKNGTTIEETGPNPGDNVINTRRPGHLSAQSMPMSQLVSILRSETGRPVLDMTGIKGVFDINLDWAPEPKGSPAEANGQVDNRPSLFTAIQEQLGLRLEAGKSPIETLVVDHAQKPSAN